MRCKSCDYPLWNLKARQCPECGTAFRPDDHEFVINSVRFCCPYCDQAYYGTGAKGHLVPFEFNCVKCSHRVSMNDMVLRPAEGIGEEQTKVDRMPWIDRSSKGWMRAWFATIGQALVAPGRLMRGVPEEASIGPAWGFAALTHVVVTIVNAIPLFCLMLIPLAASVSGGRSAAAGAGAFVGISLGFVGFGFLFLLIGTGLWVAASHGLLRLTGPTLSGMGRSCQAICYSAGANILTATPCLGYYFGWIWWLVSAVLMVKEAQRVSGLRASFAVLTPPLALLATLFAAYLWFVFAAVSMAQAGAASSVRRAETTVLTSQVLTYASQNGNQGPCHAAQLTVDNGLGAANFVGSGSSTDDTTIAVGGATLSGLDFLPPNKKRAEVKAAGDALPSNVVAHRLGDFVFTYHGMTLPPGPAPNKLWIVVFSPDPDFNPNGVAAPAQPFGPQPARQGPGLVVGYADGTTGFEGGPIGLLLANQNALRAQAGLPPLPDPQTVTHANPARAGAAAASTTSPETGPSQDASPNG